MIKANTLTTKQAAQVLGVTYHHVCRLCKNGDLEAERLGRMWLIKKGSVSRFKKEREKMALSV